MSHMQKALAIPAVAALAIAVFAAACRADTLPFDDASAGEILAATEEAMAKVESFAVVYVGTSWSLGITVTVESELQDEQNYRNIKNASRAGVPFVTQEAVVVDGEVYLNGPEDIPGADYPPTYSLPPRPG